MIDDPAANLAERLAALPDPTGLLQAIFANAPTALQIFAASGQCLFVNAAHTALFGGVPPPEYNVFEDTLLIGNGSVDLVKRAFAGETIALPPIWYDIRELRNLPPTTDISGGKRIAISAQMVPLRAASGDVSHVLMVFTDVTDAHEARESAEAAALAAEQRAQQSAFLADAGRLLSTSLDLDITLAQVATLATQSLADMVVVDLVNDDGSFRRVAAIHRDPALQPVVDVLRERFGPLTGGAQPASVAIASRKPDLNVTLDAETIAARARSSEHRDLLMKLGVRSQLAVPLLLGDRTLGAITLCHTGTRNYSEADIPLVEALASHAAIAIENARLFRAAQTARTEAEAASRSKDEFLAMLGHELRNPLAPIVTALELTRQRDGHSSERAVIERQVHHLRRLVDDLLDVSRITRGSLDLDRRTIDLGAAIHEGIELARPLIDQRKHTLVLDIEPRLAIDADRVRIAQIVANLVINAARYTEPGGTITITAKQDARDVVLRVRDTGVGIPPELLPRVFDTFTRGSRSIDRAAGGLGLGLAIVKSLTLLHGGVVAAHSDGLGHGTSVEVTLPAAGAAAAPPTPPRGTPPPPSRARATSKVMVVDDNRDAAELLTEALTDRGFDVVMSCDPFDAIRVAATHLPAVALIDIGLPGIDGYELARLLRNDPRHATLAMIALTGFGQASDRARSQAAGFAAHLVKPTSLDAIVALLDKLLVPASP